MLDELTFLLNLDEKLPLKQHNRFAPPPPPRLMVVTPPLEPSKTFPGPAPFLHLLLDL